MTYQRHNNLHRALNCRLIRPEVKNNSRQDVHCSPAHRKSEQDSFSSSESVSKLAEKKIIVTGGGKGLGAAMAAKFVSEGASVLISGRNEKILKETADNIGCKYLVLDMQGHIGF